MNTAHEALKLAIAQLDVLYLGVPDMPEHERIIHAAVMEKLRAVIAASPASPAQAAGMVELTESELVKCLATSGCIGTIKMSYESGPYSIDRPSFNASQLSSAITRALAEKNGLQIAAPTTKDKA